MKEIEEDGEMRRQRPASPAVGAAFRVVGLALLLVPPLACRQVPGRPSAPASVVSGGELQLVVSRLPGEPRRFVSAKGRVPVRILVDPELADVEEISSYVLWVAREEVRPASRTAALTARISPKNPATSAKKSRARGRTARGRRGAKAKPKPPPPVYSWKEIASSTAGETLVIVRLADGIHGLRASVIYKDGRRLLAPRRGDAPIAFLRVDTQPPELEWLEPVAKSGRQGDVLELRWSTQDVHFGRRPLVIERSVDRGESWQEIARQQAVAGISSYRWKLPRDRPEEVLFRARTWDAAGNKASALLPWRSAEAPEVATSAGGTSGSPASVVPSPAAAGESSPGADGSPGVDGGETGPSRGLRLGPILLDGFETTCLRGGSVEELSWSIIDAEVDAKTSIVLEYRFSAEDGRSSGDGGDRSSGDGSSGDGGWQVGCEGTLGDRALSWTLPATRSGECRVRLVLGFPGKSQLSPLSPLSPLLALPDPLTIDSEAPRAQFAELPSRLPAEARLGFTVEEQGCGGLRAARVYLRGEGADEWTALPEESVALAADDLSIDLRSLEEGTYELFVALEDAVGNRGEEPGTETKAQGRFALDKSPPRVDGKLTAAPWVGGFRGEVLVDLDVADCVPPLVVEGREAADNAGADWTELLRLASLALPQGTVSFPVPSTAKSY
ncbi:MAG: hypothetical protein O7J95_14855, partial [Planctomycetota bacterium]|nr:hypothetical protein [Planctomycetota bacterium]